MSAGYSAAQAYGLLSASPRLTESFTSLLEYPAACDSDGVRDGAEACDGLDLGGQTCDSLGLGLGALACAPGCVLDTQGCDGSPPPPLAVCGDSRIEQSEECDPSGQLTAASCASLGYNADASPLRCDASCHLDASTCRFPDLYALTVGPTHACATFDASGSGSQRALCWGDNRAGQAAAPNHYFNSLALGDGFSCGVVFNGALRCWGASLQDASGQPPESVTAGAQQVAAAGGYMCALLQDATLPEVRCFSDGLPPLSFSGPISTPTALALSADTLCARGADSNAHCQRVDNPSIGATFFDTQAVATAGDVACALTSSGLPDCRALDIPDGTPLSLSIAPATTLAALQGGGQSLCGLWIDGNSTSRLTCWSLADSGGERVLSAPEEPFTDPVFNGLLLGERFSVGDGYVCAQFTSGDVFCADISNAPPALRRGQHVTPSVRAHSVSVAPTTTPEGDGFGCAVKRVGTQPGYLTCWGDIPHGIGDQDLVAVSVTAGSLCALTADGTARCQPLTEGAVWRQPPAVEALSALHTDQHVACGVRRADGGIVCWGDDRFAPWADAPPQGAFVDVRVMGDEGLCGLRADGVLACSPRALQVPAALAGRRWVSFDGTAAYACGVDTRGAVACWGDGPAPDIVAGDLVKVSVASGRGCALRANGAIRCWGEDLGGAQSTFDLLTPDLRDLDVGEAQTCGLRRNGEVVCVGQTELGYR